MDHMIVGFQGRVTRLMGGANSAGGILAPASVVAEGVELASTKVEVLR